MSGIARSKQRWPGPRLMLTSILRNLLRIVLLGFSCRWLVELLWTSAKSRVLALDEALRIITAGASSNDRTSVMLVTASMILFFLAGVAISRLRRDGVRHFRIVFAAVLALFGLWVTTASEAHLLDLGALIRQCYPRCTVVDVPTETAASASEWVRQTIRVLTSARGTMWSLLLCCLIVATMRLIIRDLKRLQWYASAHAQA